MGTHCAGPNRQRYVQKADPTIRTASEKEFSLARADCELQGTATSPPSTATLSILTVRKKSNGNRLLFLKVRSRKLLFTLNADENSIIGFPSSKG